MKTDRFVHSFLTFLKMSFSSLLILTGCYLIAKWTGVSKEVLNIFSTMLISSGILSFICIIPIGLGCIVVYKKGRVLDEKKGKDSNDKDVNR